MDQATFEAYDRVVGIGSWAFILAVTTIVVMSGRWPETQTAIFILLALTGLTVLAVHELTPASVLGGARYVVEGSVGLTAATLLIVLTDGAASPFFSHSPSGRISPAFSQSARFRLRATPADQPATPFPGPRL